MAKKFAVLGSPISHSFSPLIHRVAYQALGLDWQYEAVDLPTASFTEFIEKESQSFSGFSVTMPLKEAAFAISSVHSPLCELTELANTLVKTGDSWCGFNTDIFGLSEALRRQHDGSFEKTILIGNGATARSAILAIRNLAPSSQICVLGRNAKKTSDLCFFGASVGMDVREYQLDSDVEASLTVSTIPGAAWNEFSRSLENFQCTGALFDVSYNPWPSEAAQLWIKNELPIISGIHMLVWQAIAQIRLFHFGDESNQLPSEENVASLMLGAAKDALK